VPEPTEIEKLVGELELSVDRVRSLYEQYFMGIEKLEPTVPRKDVDRRIHILRKEQIRNTAQRFRFQMIIQRYNTYQTHWQRICREIENGTYKRHVIRAQQRFGEAGAKQRRRDSLGPPPSQAPGEVRAPAPQPLSDALALELADLDREFAPASDAEEVDDLDVELVEEPPRAAPPIRQPTAGPPPPPRPSQPQPIWRKPSLAPAPPRAPQAPATPPAPAPPATAARMRAAPVAKPDPPAPRDPAELPDTRVRAIYALYVDAKRRQNESTAAITYDAVARSLRDSSAKLREKHGRAVDFEVTIKDGKAILKPVLK
jgi:hypothetical protein